ncbi:DNA-binding response OmpR family regulator [Paenarthrobacter ilicis]|uniref:DNA-binding response OmpR family regulator n=1 Tax=Paenarthrobacter ilicis TaxID=43665 RepID=A0ABX0TRK2_9MICC|nr:response regulator [Paenarthrobacter ilicis]NIJ03481.1 DNA-binding response OmpR family regulator [Paenarthrobacter ilicis]
MTQLLVTPNTSTPHTIDGTLKAQVGDPITKVMTTADAAPGPVAVVIEDDPDIQGLIILILERAGFTVYTGTTGPDGVAAVQLHNPELITTDLDLPGFSGLEVIRRVRLFSTAPLIVISGNRDSEIESITAGANAWLAKPFRPKELQHHAQTLIGSHNR